ncbi:hypothetical protein BDY24DRAFT_397225 [Mrakia frigida]|uniref:uncharacterized protein n=1 Tax=Mrakia frigida TaxID=29902 RepID=UPI003FCC0EB6
MRQSRSREWSRRRRRPPTRTVLPLPPPIHPPPPLLPNPNSPRRQNVPRTINRRHWFSSTSVRGSRRRTRPRTNRPQSRPDPTLDLHHLLLMLPSNVTTLLPADRYLHPLCRLPDLILPTLRRLGVGWRERRVGGEGRDDVGGGEEEGEGAGAGG